ncbi:quinol:electron acceptor oxidoreductase subunit ActD [Methylobacterium sp. R2-1]|uniref:quinol:electron acceptor oxidoreductase subunit ActD n=1 Tax=Methylobacterium sp. R2-1 TaxID=2587064 RepID=UPI001619B381|nr:quinol:electron acceptor oxidoreductase subunit ActD [Methylobacterium sp. R2-1]MBB2964004.1 hypothetical protein [Methylobacterium sp. R2-1]
MTEPALPPAPTPAFLYGMPVLGTGETVSSIGAALTGAVLAPAGRRWRFAVAGTLVLILLWAGLRSAVPAALAAAGAGWWIGLASGCLLISGLLLLAGVAWRCGIGRLAQTAALLCAGLAALHPVPLHSVSLAALLAAAGGFWAAALLPDLAVLRDRLAAEPDRRWSRVYRVLSAGWSGSALQWLAWERASRGFALLGILAAVAVLIDLALAAAFRTDRHDTLLPVALLVEAVLSAAGLIAALTVTLRRSLGLYGLITGRHLDILGRLILAFGLAALYCHVTENVTALLYGDSVERARLTRRLLGDEAPAFWTLMLAGLLPTQLFWIAPVRRSAIVLGLIGALVAAGLGADHVLAARTGTTETDLADLGTAAAAAIGSAGLFVLGLLLLFRLVPPVSIAETRQLALAHNPHAALGAPEAELEFSRDRSSDQGPRPGLLAVFASEAELVEAVRGLSGPDAPSRLDAYGPVPMPEAAAALHVGGQRLNRFALSGAFLGAAAFLAARVIGLADAMPEGLADVAALASPATWPVFWPVSWPLSWAMAAVPALSAGALGGVLGLGAALVVALRATRRDHRPPSALAGRFVLTIDPSREPDAARFNPAALVRRLNALPEAAGRPLALYGPSAPVRLR